MNKRAVFYAKAILSLTIVLYLITMLDWERIAHVLPNLVPGYIGLAFLLVLLSVLTSAIRWSALMKRLEIIQRVVDSWRYYLISMFYGIVLPGMIGGDVVRLGLSIKLHGMGKKGVLTASVLIERACGLVGILMIFSVMSSQLPSVLADAEDFVALPYILALTVIAIFAFFFFALKMLPKKWLVNENTKKSVLRQVFSLLERFRNLSLGAIFWILMLSIQAHLLDILASYFLAQALHVDVSFYLFLLIIPMTYVLTALPISLGGLGVREGILTFFLTKVGVPASDAVLLAFLIYLNRLTVALIGGAIQSMDKNIDPVKIKIVNDENQM